ncbi:MAG: cell division protein FtsZ [Rikenellaceae bacterium]
MDINFKMPQSVQSIIMVAGVGGGGGNAVKHMYSLGVDNVSYMVINTDIQALDRSPIQNKIQLGNGLGAGNNPEKARIDAEQSADVIREALKVSGVKMLFITAGMGGGTGTGASPVVARIAREMDILTVGIVSIPYAGEGPRRVKQAVSGIDELLPYVDSLIVINNEHIAQIYGKLGIKEAHAKADDILTMAAKSISEIVLSPMDVNVDFADVTTIMKDDLALMEGENANKRNGKVALMGSAVGDANGEDRALRIAEEAVNSPLLHHNDIRGARKVLLSINWGNDEVQVSYEEALKVMDFIQQRSGLVTDMNSNQADVIWGAGEDKTLGDKIRITVVATGFNADNIPEIKDHFASTINPRKAEEVKPKEPQRQVVSIGDEATATPVRKSQPVMGDGEIGLVSRGESSDGVVVRELEEVHPQRISVSSRREVSGLETQISTIELGAERSEREGSDHSGSSAARSSSSSSRGGASSVAAEPTLVKPSIRPMSARVSENSSSLVQGGDGDYDKPAYLRRAFSVYKPDGESAAAREYLGGQTASRSHSDESTLSLFDEQGSYND